MRKTTYQRTSLVLDGLVILHNREAFFLVNSSV